MKLKLIEKIEEVPHIYTFKFEKPQGFTFIPGQYLVYKIPNTAPDGRGERRYFTISSAPFEETLNLTTKITGQSSTFKKDLLKINIGDELEITGPGGEFLFDEKYENHIFVAGGIGVTPFRSMLLNFKQKHLNPNITLLFASKEEKILFEEEIKNLENVLSNFKVEYFLGENHLTPEQVFSAYHSAENSAIYLSGPEPMVASFLESLEEMGISKENIKRDYFPGYTWK